MGTGKLPGKKLPHTPSQKIVLRKITPENIIPRKESPLVNRSNPIENKLHGKMSP